jgi:RND superfamily putative drug exporter
MLDRLGRTISRHPWWVLAGWVVAVFVAFAAAVGGVFGQSLFDRLASGAVAVPGQTQDGSALLTRTTNDGPSAILLLDHVDIKTTTAQRAIDRIRPKLEKIPQVKSQKAAGAKGVQDPFQQVKGKPSNLVTYQGPLAESGLLSDDARAILVVVTLKPRLSDAENTAGLAAADKLLNTVQPRVPGSKAYVGGITAITNQVINQVEVDLRTGEGVALPISLLIMIVVFGGFLAAGLPLIGAIAAISGALAVLFGFSYAIPNLDATTVNTVTVLSLGLCIDYGLLLVSRYREEMTSLPGDPHLPPTRRQRELALRRTMTSAGRTVLFSGVTVTVALSGLIVFQSSYLRAIGAAGVSVVAVAMLVALTLVPALLAIVRTRMIRPGLVHRIPGVGALVRKLGDVSPDEGFFSRLARVVQRFPLIVLMIVLSALFVMSLPILHLTLVASDVALLPKDQPQRELFDNLQSRFQYASTPAITVVARAPLQAPGDKVDPRKDVQELLGQINHIPGVIPTDYSTLKPTQQGTKATGPVTAIPVRVGGSFDSPIAKQVVEEIRDISPGYATYTTGTPSVLLDYEADLRGRAAYAVLIVVVATFVLLFMMTGSVLVPLKALLMNVISLGASLGVLVWAFQDGNAQGLLNFTSAGGIETFVAPLTLAFGFGLAMDYEVFLLSRIAEYRREGYSNNESVAMGLQRSGRIITSAALIIVVVFAGFVAGKVLIIKETGTSLAVAVTVDATLVRILLVPATMTLLGDWNWWAPGFLRRFHDRYGLREH